GKRIGEVWFEPPAEMPDTLVKYIFTSEKLSVQVHPSDAQAAELGEADRGKEECWLVIAAEPGAKLGIGFKQPIDAETMRRAAVDGSIEDMMAWHPVKPGDFFYIPANTVHAIGAGITLIEIQQNSDITYRLYDYGRPRELHLDKGMQVASSAPYQGGKRIDWPDHGAAPLVQGPYFSAYLVTGGVEPAGWPLPDRPALLIPISGAFDTAGINAAAGTAAVIRQSGNLRGGKQSHAILVCPPIRDEG
ncbi:MAG: class I mannose-6-phosphate isomerase, partial [Novosphingobium sp.]|nr:class I mannose-6-phosphate isomerase [Novosphingobium sp.]